MDKSCKIYKKALNQYYNGNIEKSLELSEKSISESMKNKAAINLKGLLYYFKGELNSATALWKLNYDVNKDSVSKKYLQDSKADEKNWNVYCEALDLVRKLDISQALTLLKECEESDFNCINVNNYLAFCYIKKGEYQIAIEYTDKVLKLDRKNIMALKNKKLLIQYGAAKRQVNFKLITPVLGVMVIVVVIFFSRKAIVNKSNTAKTEPVKHIAVSEVKSQQPKIDKSVKQKVQKVQEVFPYENMKNFIETKDFENIYSVLQKWKKKNLKIDDKALIIKGEQLLKKEGIVYFYHRGTESFKSGDNKKAEQFFLKAYDYSEENYLYPHIIFMLASAFEADGRVEDCLNYYCQYDNLYDKKYDTIYPKRCYEETVLYTLAILNNNIDAAKAKAYAKKLSELFPKSNYNNSIIKQINKK